MLPTGITAGQTSKIVRSMKNHLAAARPERGSWVQEESPDSEVVRQTTSNPPHPSLCTSVCRSLLSLFAPEKLLRPLWKPWLWQRTHPARILSPCKQSDSGSHTRGLPSVCDLRGGQRCPSVAQTHRSGSLCMTPHSCGVFQNGPSLDQNLPPTPTSRPLPCRGGWRRAGALLEPAEEALISDSQTTKLFSPQVEYRAH